MTPDNAQSGENYLHIDNNVEPEGSDTGHAERDDIRRRVATNCDVVSVNEYLLHSSSALSATAYPEAAIRTMPTSLHVNSHLHMSLRSQAWECTCTISV